MSTGSKNVSEVRRIGEPARRAARIAAALGVLGLAGGAALGFVSGWDVFFRSYLLNYCYILSLALGALFFVLLQHLVRAGWSVSVRRLAEFTAQTLPLLAILFLPLLVPVLTGMRGVWEWTDPHAVAADALLQHKRPYLNVPFFIIRAAFYFTVWVALARFFYRQSVAQDTTGDPRLTLRMQWWSGPGMVLFALTVTFFAFDALMSLNPHWFSTIFGVYFFSGCAVGFFALLAILVSAVQRGGWLKRSITVEHYHDIGKLAFGFVVFWAYIAFSQYLLIWYANLPEETVWYLPRQGDTWWIGVSLLLLGGHFVAPFLALLSRWPKRRPGTLALAGAWLLLMHWLDLYYLVAPRPHAGEHTAPLHATDGLLLLGLGSLFVAALVRPMVHTSLIPERDPRLPESLAFQNV
ncbi:MAG: quinol:cytochrome C oxidoreductase [Phycisphaerae bacterium]|nr:quinol:cytochrome C oxidoreductase [Phycisphaerae bacterium]